VDLVREKLPFRTQAWIEFLGLTFFMIPYCLIVGYFASVFAFDSFMVMEKSASTVGLSYRWIIKSVLVLGLFTALVAGVAVWLQTVLVLFGPKELRFKLMTLEWPEDVARRGGRLTTSGGT
jgi:TRAP-type mannitol/chloroaromatic compound transport system permease small subunit